MVIGAVLAFWLLGCERGVLGAAVGAFIGALAAAGLVTATTGPNWQACTRPSR